MDRSTECINTAAPSVRSKLCALCSQVIKADYDVTLRVLPDENGSEPLCSHHIRGSMKRDLLCLLALGATATAIAAGLWMLIHACCASFCK